MVAASVLLLASLGAILGMLAASRQLRDGRNFSSAALLVDARVQRLRLQNKGTVISGATAYNLSSGLPTTLAVGAAPWVMDPLAANGNDLGTGAVFKVTGDGVISRYTPATAPTTCASLTASADIGAFCREVAVTAGGPTTVANGVPAASQATLWVRVTQVRSDGRAAVVVSSIETVTQ